MLRKLTASFMVSILTWCLGCASGAATTPTTAPAGVSLSRDIQPIFNQSCVVCHQGASAQGGLSLDPGAAYANLVNKASSQAPAVKLVEPGEPSRSYLIDKLNGTHGAVGGSGARMPFGQPPLPQAQVELISQWISGGALNN